MYGLAVDVIIQHDLAIYLLISQAIALCKILRQLRIPFQVVTLQMLQDLASQVFRPWTSDDSKLMRTYNAHGLTILQRLLFFNTVYEDSQPNA